jgi:hypothetical protein
MNRQLSATKLRGSRHNGLRSLAQTTRWIMQPSSGTRTLSHRKWHRRVFVELCFVTITPLQDYVVHMCGVQSGVA